MKLQCVSKIKVRNGLQSHKSFTFNKSAILRSLFSRVEANTVLIHIFYFYFYRGSKNRKVSVPIYCPEEEGNDLSDLGIGTSSASGKSSLSEDFDNHSVIVSNKKLRKSCSLGVNAKLQMVPKLIVL